MRHGTATAFLNAGADLGFVQELLGHSDPSVTRRVYVEWLKDGFKRSYDAYAGQALRSRKKSQASYEPGSFCVI